MTRAEIRWFVKEYRFSAERAKTEGIDGIEIHANHNDVIEWFLSPKSNRRSDEYGGSFENRICYLGEIINEMREGVGKDFVIGVRMNMLEQEPRGCDASGGAGIAAWLQATGKVDYLHFVMGSPWGDPSYVQPHYYKPAQWADTARNLRKHVTLPVVYTGKVLNPAVAEQVIASGAADVVGMARSHVAEQDLVGKAKRGEMDRIRPCIGCNECIARHYVEGIPFGCTVNPATGFEKPGAPSRATKPRKVLVIGGGPGGM